MDMGHVIKFKVILFGACVIQAGVGLPAQLLSMAATNCSKLLIDVVMAERVLTHLRVIQAATVVAHGEDPIVNLVSPI